MGGDCEVGAGARLTGPARDRRRLRIGEGSAMKDSIVWPGTEVPAQTILVGAVAGTSPLAASWQPALAPGCARSAGPPAGELMLPAPFLLLGVLQHPREQDREEHHQHERLLHHHHQRRRR